MRGGEGPEAFVSEKRAPRDGGLFHSSGFVRLAFFLLFGHLSSVRARVPHVRDEPPRAPQETEDAEQVEHGGPPAQVKDDGGRDDQTAEGSDVEAAERRGDGFGSLRAGDATGKHASRGGGRNAFPEADQEARREKRGERELRAQRRDERAQRPQHHTREQHELASVLLREPTAGNLRKRVAPKERGLHQSFLHGRPAERGSHGDDSDRHVDLVQVAQHERYEEGEDHPPALLLALLGHVEAHVLCDGVHFNRAAAARVGDDNGGALDRDGRGRHHGVQRENPRFDRTLGDESAGALIARRHRAASHGTSGAARRDARTGENSGVGHRGHHGRHCSLDPRGEGGV